MISTGDFSYTPEPTTQSEIPSEISLAPTIGKDKESERQQNTRYRIPIIDKDEHTYQVIDHDKNEADAIGGDIYTAKADNSIRISGCNPNGIKVQNLKSHIQHSLDLDINIQCYSEVNANVQHPKVGKAFFEIPKSMDQTVKATWCTSEFQTESEFKPGGTGIMTNGTSSSRIKESGKDKLGRWTYQVLEGTTNHDVVIFSVYQCCISSSAGMKTAHRQQRVLLSEMDTTGNNDPRKHFGIDLKATIRKLSKKYKNIRPIIVGDWNEECTSNSIPMEICHEFGLVDIFHRLYPHQENFNTYNRGSRRIDFALAPPEIADLVTNFVYEPFFYRLKGDHRGFYFDIPEALLFGNAKPSVYDVNGRNLNSKDIKNVKKYITSKQYTITSFHKTCLLEYGV